MAFSDDIMSFLKKSPKSKKVKSKSPKSPSPKSASPKFYTPQSSTPKKRGRPKTRKCAPGVKQADCKSRSECLWTKGNFCRTKTNKKK
jgi:hypothetical protein